MALKQNKKFIISDLDGTLINSIPDLKSAINYALSQQGYEELSLEEITPTVGNGAKEMLDRSLELAKGEKASEDELKEVIKIYTNYYKEHSTVDTFLYPHVKETLAYLKDHGYQLVICTNKPIDFVGKIIQHLEIDTYFEEWIGEGSLPTKKPDAGPLNYLMEKYGYTQDESVMIGDSKNDILAAQNAGIESIGLTYGYNYNESIADYNPTVVVDDFGEIQKML